MTWCVLASLHRRRTRFFSMSPRGEIAFPMPLTKSNIPCAVKVKAAAVVLENVRHSCPMRQAIEACLTQFYGLVAVLWMQGNFALARIRGLTHRSIALTNLASTLNGEHNERTTNKPDPVAGRTEKAESFG